jgi:hypothetical protein
MIRSSLHYLIRIAISILWGGLFALAGWPWWLAVILGGILFAWFIWAPRSGRYVVRSESGRLGLWRDERTQAIVNKAARNAFIVTMLAIGGIIFYFGIIVSSNVPVVLISLIMFLAFVTYFISDLWLRRL